MLLESTGKPDHAAIYVRVSTAALEEDGTSLGTQEERCRAYACEHGYIVDAPHIYREVHTSVELWERPQWGARCATR